MSQLRYKMKKADYIYMKIINEKIDKLNHITNYDQIDNLIFAIEELKSICINYNIHQRIRREEDKDEYRNEIRELQDKIIIRCEQLGYSDYQRISKNMPPEITLGQLKSFIFPTYENELKEVLRIISFLK